MRYVKNYTVAYQGAFSTVYASFEKKPVTEKEEVKTTGKKENINSDARSSNVNRSFTFAMASGDESNTDSHFTASVGDGKGAKLDLKCQNCTVDFK